MPPRIRRIVTRPQNEIISPESQIQQRRVPKAYKTVVDQGYRVIRLQKFLEICRSPLTVPEDVIVIKKFFLGPDGSSLESSLFEITHGDLANERRWLELRQDHEEISPIMKKLDTVSVEGDLSRYMVINKNMERLNIGITKPSRDDLGKMTSVEYYFPRRIDDNVDIIKRGLGASHFILESHFGEMDVFNKLGAAELVLQQIEQLMGEINRSFRSLRHRIYHPQLSGWAGRLYKSVVNSVDKSFVIAKAILDSNFDELVSIPTPNGGEPRTISHHEALANYTQTSGRVLLKLREIIEQNRGKEPDIDYTTLRSMAGIQRRIQSNVDAIQESVGMGYVGSRSWDGKRVLKKVDALDVVIKQLDRNIRSANIVLTSLGLHQKSQNFYAKPNKLVAKEVKFTSGASVTPSQPPISHFNPDLSFSPSPITGDIPGNKREYSTISFPNVIRKVKPQALNEFGTRLPSKGLLQRLGRGDRDRGPPRKNAFGKEIPNERIVNIRPKLAIGQKSIREKMLIKEEERLKSMQGLGYSLMAADRVENGGTTIQNVVEKDMNGIASMWEGSGDMGGLTDESGLAPLKKGDLCELRLGSSSALGIYLRPSPHGQPTADFLSWNGDIVMLPPTRISFSIPSFISEESTANIINSYDKIYENSGLPVSRLSEVVLPRSEMVEVLDKFRVFSKKSRTLYAQEKARFKELYERMALPNEDIELTLFEAAEEIFGETYGDVELYTTHLALMEDGVRYMADRAVHRATSTFKMRSKEEVKMINSVTEKVRTSTNQDDFSLKKGKSLQQAQVDIFQEFVKKARYMIDLSREYQNKDLNSSKSGVKRVEIKDVVWDKNDMLFINYVKASVLQSGTQAVPMSGLVPVILREMGRYEGVLNPVTAYHFCTEIGVWGRWENLALRQKNVSFPGFGTSKIADQDQAFLSEINSPKAVEKLELVDSLKHIRKDWGNMEVFCIDDASAHEIDDGISLERVNENENWVHIHIANPTAWLPSNHWLSDLAFRRKQSLYLPEKVFPMLPPSLTEVIGLGPNRGVMTMSAKVNKDGEVLDTCVQAGFVRNVKRYTYDTVSKALGYHMTGPLTIKVGNFPEFTKAPEAKLSQRQIADLKTLSEIALAYRKARTKNNMIAVSTPQLDVNIYTGIKSHIHPESRYPSLYRGHPSIRLTIDSARQSKSANFLVSELMQLANNVTAIFCGTKNIAAPFRAMEYDLERKDVVSSFKNKILPSRDELGNVSADRGLKYMMLIGQTRISASQKPHRLLGFDDGYVRGTSPLRRYSDMIAHWQIQSYLLGKEPRTHKQLAPFVSEMDRGERLSAFTMKESTRFWAVVAIKRMLELGEPKLPQNLTLMVMDKLPYPALSTGLVLELGMAAKMKFSSKKEELDVGLGDVVGIEPFAAVPGEKFVWFEFKGMLKKAEETDDIFI